MKRLAVVPCESGFTWRLLDGDAVIQESGRVFSTRMLALINASAELGIGIAPEEGTDQDRAA